MRYRFCGKEIKKPAKSSLLYAGKKKYFNVHAREIHSPRRARGKDMKLLNEIQKIINTAETYPQKCKQVLALNLERRPGREQAEALIEQFTKKYRIFCDRKIIKTRVNYLHGHAFDFKPIPNPCFRNYNPQTWRLNNHCAKNEYVVNAWIRHTERYYEKKCETRYVMFILPKYHRQKYSSISEAKKHLRSYRKRVFDNYEIVKKEDAKKKTFVEETGLDPYYFNKTGTIFDVQNSNAEVARLGDYVFKKQIDISENWDAYSKSWHKAHGPKRTVDGRYLEIRYKGQRVAYIQVNSFRGNWLIDAIVKHFGLNKVKVSKEIRPVQLNDYLSVNPKREIGNVKTYELALMNNIVMYCAVSVCADGKNVNYHAATESESISGLRDKINKINVEYERLSEKVTADILKERHGFCRFGMTEFASDMGLDIEGEYSILQLRDAVDKNPKARSVSRFKNELKQIRVLN